MYQCYIRFCFTTHDGKMFDISEILEQDPMFIFKTLNEIEVVIGGNRIDQLTGYQIMMLDKMRLDVNQSLEGQSLIHVPFFFCTQTANALPMIAIGYNDVEITIKTRKLLPNVLVTPEILMSQSFASEPERSFISRDPVQYAISLFERPLEFVIAGGDPMSAHRIDFNHMTNALYFTLHKDISAESMFEPLRGQLIHYELHLNGSVRAEGDEQTCLLDKIDAKINKNAPIYVIPFALEPLDRTQHTMSLNLSHIDNCTLRLVAQPNIGCIRVWSGYWNFLRVMSGMAGLAFSH